VILSFMAWSFLSWSLSVRPHRGSGLIGRSRVPPAEIDVYTEDQAAEVDRLLALADPEGDRFCVVGMPRSDSRYAAEATGARASR